MELIDSTTGKCRGNVIDLNHPLDEPIRIPATVYVDRENWETLQIIDTGIKKLASRLDTYYDSRPVASMCRLLRKIEDGVFTVAAYTTTEKKISNRRLSAVGDYVSRIITEELLPLIFDAEEDIVDSTHHLTVVPLFLSSFLTAVYSYLLGTINHAMRIEDFRNNPLGV